MRYDSVEVTKLRDMMATLRNENDSLRAASYEKQKDVNELVILNAKSKERAEAAELREQDLKDQIFAKDRLRGLLEKEVQLLREEIADIHAAYKSTLAEKCDTKDDRVHCTCVHALRLGLAAQAQEIKTMKDIIDSDKKAGIPIDALHVACRERDQAKKHIREIALALDPHDSGAPDEGVVWLTENYVKNTTEMLAAKDRLLAEQERVAKQMSECLEARDKKIAEQAAVIDLAKLALDDCYRWFTNAAEKHVLPNRSEEAVTWIIKASKAIAALPVSHARTKPAPFIKPCGHDDCQCHYD